MRFRVKLLYIHVYDLYSAMGHSNLKYIVKMPLIVFRCMLLTCRKFFISNSELLAKRLIGNLRSLYFLEEVERLMGLINFFTES